jgi:hypothetical protein
MKHTLLAFLLAAVSLFAGEPPETKRISAGPFSVFAPVEWAASAVVEKVPIAPLYSRDAWRTAQRDPSFLLKGSYENRPQHWAIRFPKLDIKVESRGDIKPGEDENAPQILIHKSAEWDAAFRDGSYTAKDANRSIQRLRQDLDAWGKRNLLCSPAFMDAHLEFICVKKKIRFKGGYGYRMLAQWNTELSLATKRDLHYLFIGMSDDDSCQIIATFPLDIPGLADPDNRESEHIGYSYSRYSDVFNGYDKYKRLAKAWLVDNAAKSNPAIKDLDAIIGSLAAAKWK